MYNRVGILGLIMKVLHCSVVRRHLGYTKVGGVAKQQSFKQSTPSRNIIDQIIPQSFIGVQPLKYFKLQLHSFLLNLFTQRKKMIEIIITVTTNDLDHLVCYCIWFGRIFFLYLLWHLKTFLILHHKYWAVRENENKIEASQKQIFVMAHLTIKNLLEQSDWLSFSG